MIAHSIRLVIAGTCYDSSTSCNNLWDLSPNTCTDNIAISLPITYNSYCQPNDEIIWKNGISDGSVSSTETLIDYNFIICQEASFSDCGYVPLYPADAFACGKTLPNSGIMVGTGINLLYHNTKTLLKLGASTETIETLSRYFEFTGSRAAELICNEPFTIDVMEAYTITIGLMDKYLSEIQTLYNTDANSGTLPFDELPLGIRTVITSIYMKWSETTFFDGFWNTIISNNFEEAIETLRSWYSDGRTDKRLSSEANVMEAALGCLSGTNNIDVVFLLDTSGSVGINDFEIALNWMVQFIEYFDESNLNSGAVRFGVATFSDVYTDHIHLNHHSTLNGYTTSILSIPYDGGSTYLGNALKQIALNQFTVSNGMREASMGVARLLIVLTDGISHDDVAEGAVSVDVLGINIFAIGIGSYDIEQLQDIASKDNIYALVTFTDLNSILSGITVRTCNTPTQLDIENNFIVHEIVVQKHEIQYFQIAVSENTGVNHENVILSITQQIGCIYVYVSVTNQYPSYFENDVNFTSCSQSFKQIVLAPVGTVIYIGIEGVDDVDTVYNMDIDACIETDLECQVGTNYNPSLNNDPSYSISNSVDSLIVFTCNADCNVPEHKPSFEISVSFDDHIVHNLDAMECFIFDTINPFIEDSFDSCSISIDSVIGGQSDVLCVYPPCVWLDQDESSDTSLCSHVNITFYAFSCIDDIRVADAIQSLFNDSFAICANIAFIKQDIDSNHTDLDTVCNFTSNNDCKFSCVDSLFCCDYISDQDGLKQSLLLHRIKSLQNVSLSILIIHWIFMVIFVTYYLFSDKEMQNKWALCLSMFFLFVVCALSVTNIGIIDWNNVVKGVNMLSQHNCYDGTTNDNLNDLKMKLVQSLIINAFVFIFAFAAFCACGLFLTSKIQQVKRRVTIFYLCSLFIISILTTVDYTANAGSIFSSFVSNNNNDQLLCYETIDLNANKSLIDAYDGYTVVPFEFKYDCITTDPTDVDQLIQEIPNIIGIIYRENNIDVYVTDNMFNYTIIQCGEVIINIKTYFIEKDKEKILNITASNDFADEIVEKYVDIIDTTNSTSPTFVVYVHHENTTTIIYIEITENELAVPDEITYSILAIMALFGVLSTMKYCFCSDNGEHPDRDGLIDIIEFLFQFWAHCSAITFCFEVYYGMNDDGWMLFPFILCVCSIIIPLFISIYPYIYVWYCYEIDFTAKIYISLNIILSVLCGSPLRVGKLFNCGFFKGNDGDIFHYDIYDGMKLKKVAKARLMKEQDYCMLGRDAGLLFIAALILTMWSVSASGTAGLSSAVSANTIVSAFMDFFFALKDLLQVAGDPPCFFICYLCCFFKK